MRGRKTCFGEAERVGRRCDKRYPKVAAEIRAQVEETLVIHDLPGGQCR